MMRLRSIIALAACLLLAGPCLDVCGAQTGSGPRISFKEKNFLFKDVEEGTLLEHAFEISNTGDQTLVIEKVSSSWGCAVASYDKSIPPGGAGKITLRVDTKGYRGKISKSAKIYINDPKDRVHYISIEALIHTAISVSPEIAFLDGKAGQVVERVVEVRAEKDKALRLEPSHFDLDQKMTYTLEEIQPGRHYRVRFTNRPGPAEIYHGYLRLKTNYPERPEVSIRIRGKFRK